MSSVRDTYLQPGSFIDSDHPLVESFAREHSAGSDSRERAVSLYYAVRDSVRYNPFQNFLLDDNYRGSVCLQRGEGWCVPKAALLAACARVQGIPARVGFADVKNHLTTPRLTERMGTDLFIYHGYAELLIEGKWVKATPAFNLDLCTKFRVRALEFDGREDSVFHPFDADNRRHMEYVRDHGAFSDVPAERIKQAFSEIYPKFYSLGPDAANENFG